MPPARRNPRAPSSSAAGRTEILLEEIRAQNSATIDAVRVLERRMDERFERVDQRFDVLEAVVRQNSADIRQNSADIRQNSADIRQNSADIRQNSADIQLMSTRIDGVDGKVDRLIASDLDARVAALEGTRG